MIFVIIQKHIQYEKKGKKINKTYLKLAVVVYENKRTYELIVVRWGSFVRSIA